MNTATPDAVRPCGGLPLPGNLPLLGVHEMDKTHEEFIHLVQQLCNVENSSFNILFQQFLAHTQAHFSHEQELMEQTRFPAIAEHTAEHRRILGELDRFNTKVRHGIFMYARAYVREMLPDWFKLHLATMDSALAAHILQTQSSS